MSSESKSKKNEDRQTGSGVAGASDDDILKVIRETEVEKEQVVSMVEGLVDILGKIGGQPGGLSVPRSSSTATENAKKLPVNLEYIESRLDESLKNKSSASLKANDTFMSWVETEGCKQKRFFEELKLLRKTIEIAGESNDFDLGVLASSRALRLAQTHARRESELLSELFWVQADFYARLGKMSEAYRSLRQCVAHADPDATEDSDTYRELADQLALSKKKGELARSAAL